MSSKPVRVGVAVAKARLAEIVHEAPMRRTIIQRRGKDAAVVIGIAELERLEASSRSDMAELLAKLHAWRAQSGGVADFEPERAQIAPQDPFGSTKRRSRGAG